MAFADLVRNGGHTAFETLASFNHLKRAKVLLNHSRA
jgi:hypothetical protein